MDASAASSPRLPATPGSGADFVALAARLAGIVGLLREVVAAHAGRQRAAAPLAMLIWHRVGRAAQRFEWLVARLVAGGVARPRSAGRVRGIRAAVPRHPADAWRDLRLPSGFGWLLRLVQATATPRLQLEALLAAPEMAALLAAEPAAGRVLRPLCRMLAIAPGPGLRRARRPRAAAVVKDAPPAPEPMRPPVRWPWTVPARLRRGSLGKKPPDHGGAAPERPPRPR